MPKTSRLALTLQRVKDYWPGTTDSEARLILRRLQEALRTRPTEKSDQVFLNRLGRG